MVDVWWAKRHLVLNPGGGEVGSVCLEAIEAVFIDWGRHAPQDDVIPTRVIPNILLIPHVTYRHMSVHRTVPIATCV